jgi:hypothetical protein
MWRSTFLYQVTAEPPSDLAKNEKKNADPWRPGAVAGTLVKRGIRSGDAGAAAPVFQRFAGRLIAPARSRLGDRLRAKVDPDDVVQSVYKSFFLRHANGELDPVD